MGSFILVRWVALRVCFIVLVVQLHLALGWRYPPPLFANLFGGGQDHTESAWEGLCKVSIISHGYKCQDFHVTGLDGYIMGLERIPEGCSSSGDDAKKKPPVLLQHGVLVDGMTWMIGSPKESLAFVLADSGFDVWISNTRGTRSSKRHVSLDESQQEYWNWTWDDVAKNDLPAIVDFVYNQTGQKLHYIGHSMGTTIAMAALSEGRLADQLSSLSLLSPVAYMNLMTNAMAVLTANAFIGELGDMLGMEEFDLRKVLSVKNFWPNGQFAAQLFSGVCKRIGGIDLDNLVTKFISQNCCLNSTAFQFAMDHALQSTSMKNIVHFSQTFRNGGFLKKYDYGSPSQNMKHYGKPEAPGYNLCNIPRNLPMFLSFGGNDKVADVKDVNHLLEDLKTHDKDKITTHFVSKYAHMDFIFAMDVKEQVYNTLIDFLRRMSS
ncbi:triacylglycerol lipase 2-like [Macadamia integrifolia]|uniref:triacylglycerol lipase 2-like n=1 Tax=Macadamia integrifolia TaxID=60698 RepID=UPI001C4FF7E8|nr:triacylglycerol lipase 2-like [Macadamia integrifolia]